MNDVAEGHLTSRDASGSPIRMAEADARTSAYKHLAASQRSTLRPGYTPKSQMKRVTGIGGIFFNANDHVALRAWYKQHLGIDVEEWGGTAFTWTDAAGNPTTGTTAWSIGCGSHRRDSEFHA